MTLRGRPAPSALEKARVDVLGKDSSISEATLGDFWRESPALIVFLRHLACPGCSEEVGLLAPHLAELSDLGVRVVLVTPSTPERLESFAERMRLVSGNAEIACDPSLAAYRAAELERSRWATYGPLSVVASLKLYALGHGAPRSMGDGDVQQQGGALLIARGGDVLIHHQPHRLSEHTPFSDVLDRALALAAERATDWA